MVTEHWDRLSREVVKSLSGDVQNLLEQNPVQPAVGEPALEGSWTRWAVDRGLCQPKPFCLYLKIHYKKTPENPVREICIWDKA